ncbi:hypothetical protein OROGR_032565 [Orobanche gracilis]
MASGSTLQAIDDDDDFDWEAAVEAIDVACCQAIAAEKPPTSISNFNSSSNNRNPQDYYLDPVREGQKRGNFDLKHGSFSSTRQSTLDKFIGVSSGNSKKPVGKVEVSKGVSQNNCNYAEDIVHRNGKGVAECEYNENGCVKIDHEAAKSWIYPVNIPLRDYQFAITRTALFSNTLVVLPTGLGKTLIAAVVMYNFFRWFPEGKIVFAAPSRPLVLQQIEACHNIVGIPQEWTIDLTGQTNPKKRADLWKHRRVFFVTPQVLEKDIHSGSCLVKHLVCLVIDEAHRATGNYSYCVAVRELMDTPIQLRTLALTATPGSKQQTIQHVIDNLRISTLEYRSESDPDVIPYVHDRKIELIEVAMGDEAVEIDNLLSEAVRPFISRLSAFGLMQTRDFQTLSPPELLNSRDKFRQEPPQDVPHTKYGEIEGYFGVLITLCHVRKLLSSHGIRPAVEMLGEKLKQGHFARFMSRNEVLLKAKLLMQQTVSHGAPNPKLAKLLEVLVDHFKVTDSKNSRVIIFSNFRGSVRDILDALTNIGELVKATEFIGQSSGKTSKGQSQKVQQAILQKFRTGGYNVIVATSIAEEGLDIMEVDLVVCFDANVSPLRMIQRMGRTGRAHAGRVDILSLFHYNCKIRNHLTILITDATSLTSLLVLACEGSELKGYMRKQAKGKAIRKHMRNGGMNSFSFHLSPRMVPHVFRPEVQFLEMSIEEFVPRGKKIRDYNNPVTMLAYENKLTDAESDVLAKYFGSSGEISWRPSLITFPHFQAFPSPVDKVVHSSRTGMLIDTMQYLQGFTFSKDSKTLSTEDLDILDPSFRVEAVEPHDEMVEYTATYCFSNFIRSYCRHFARDSDGPTDPAKEKLKEIVETDANDLHIEDSHKRKTCIHTPLFDSEFVSVDHVGNVLISSLPRLPLDSNSKHIEGNIIGSANHLTQDNPSSCSRLPEENLLESSPCNLDGQKGELFCGDDENIFESPVSRTPTEMNVSCEDHIIVHDQKLQTVVESSSDSMDSELSPRLTSFIESGIVPESPVHNSGTLKHDESTLQDCSLGKTVAPCPNDHVHDMQTPVLHWNTDAPGACTPPIPVAKERQSPFVKLSSTSGSRNLILDSGVKPETVERQCKFRRLRKLGDLGKKALSEPKEQTGMRIKYKTSKGKKKRAMDVADFIEEEAEVSSEGMEYESDNDEDEYDNSSYEDSFIDDGANLTSVSTQTGVGGPNMMAIYRRSLLSQSPFQRLPTEFSPDSAVESRRMDGSVSTSGSKHVDTPQTGLQSTDRISRLSCDEDTITVDSRKRKLSYYQAQSVPMVNLDKEFSSIAETAGENSSMQIQQVERAEKNIDNIFEDDRFYEGLDLDAIEEEATKLLRQKSECSTLKKTTLSEPVQHIFGVMDSPSFDLGI